MSNPARTTVLARLTGHTSTILAVAVIPDGRTLASAGDDRAIELTHPDVGPAVRRVCATTDTTLTPVRWHQYVPELPFNPPCR